MKLVIDTERLQIRNLRTIDLADFHFYRSNPDITKYQSFNVLTKKQAEEFILDQKRQGIWQGWRLGAIWD